MLESKERWGTGLMRETTRRRIKIMRESKEGGETGSTVIQFRLNQCLIWHLHCRGSKWDPCWNWAIKDTSECYIWQSMSCLSGAEIQIKLSRLEPTISSILIQYCTIEPHLLIQKSRQYVKSLVTTVGGEKYSLKTLCTQPPLSPLADNAQRPNSYSLIGGDKVDFHRIIFIGTVS